MTLSKNSKKVVEGDYHVCNYIFGISTPNSVKFGRGYLLGWPMTDGGGGGRVQETEFLQRKLHTSSLQICDAHKATLALSC